MSENTAVLTASRPTIEDTETVTASVHGECDQYGRLLPAGDGEQSGDLNQQRGDGAERGQKLGRGVVDGEQWRSGEDDHRERGAERDVVDDAATLTLETQALTEDAVSENTVVLSYEANDEDTETGRWCSRRPTNTEGYYQLDTENNQVTLTSKGATALNEGKSLGEVSLTASSGDPVKTTTASVEPNVTYVDDAATLTLETRKR